MIMDLPCVINNEILDYCSKKDFINFSLINQYNYNSNIKKIKATNILDNFVNALIIKKHILKHYVLNLYCQIDVYAIHIIIINPTIAPYSFRKEIHSIIYNNHKIHIDNIFNQCYRYIDIGFKNRTNITDNNTLNIRYYLEAIHFKILVHMLVNIISIKRNI